MHWLTGRGSRPSDSCRHAHQLEIQTPGGNIDLIAYVVPFSSITRRAGCYPIPVAPEWSSIDQLTGDACRNPLAVHVIPKVPVVIARIVPLVTPDHAHAIHVRTDVEFPMPA